MAGWHPAWPLWTDTSGRWTWTRKNWASLRDAGWLAIGNQQPRKNSWSEKCETRMLVRLYVKIYVCLILPGFQLKLKNFGVLWPVAKCQLTPAILPIDTQVWWKNNQDPNGSKWVNKHEKILICYICFFWLFLRPMISIFLEDDLGVGRFFSQEIRVLPKNCGWLSVPHGPLNNIRLVPGNSQGTSAKHPSEQLDCPLKYLKPQKRVVLNNYSVCSRCLKIKSDGGSWILVILVFGHSLAHCCQWELLDASHCWLPTTTDWFSRYHFGSGRRLSPGTKASSLSMFELFCTNEMATWLPKSMNTYNVGKTML